jgi:hypothetical protein
MVLPAAGAVTVAFDVVPEVVVDLLSAQTGAEPKLFVSKAITSKEFVDDLVAIQCSPSTSKPIRFQTFA